MRRPNYRSNVSGTEAFGIIVSALITFALGVAFLGWCLMIAVGIAASFHVVGGTLPFWDALAVTFLLRIALTIDAGTGKT